MIPRGVFDAFAVSACGALHIAAAFLQGIADGIESVLAER